MRTRNVQQHVPRFFFALRPDFRQISCVLPDLLSKERLLHHTYIRKHRFRIKFGMTKPSVHAVERKTAPQPPARARKVRFCVPAHAFSDEAELGAKKKSPQPPARARKVRFCAPAHACSDQAELGAKKSPHPPALARKVRFCAPAPAFSDQAELGAKKNPRNRPPGHGRCASAHRRTLAPMKPNLERKKTRKRILW